MTAMKTSSSLRCWLSVLSPVEIVAAMRAPVTGETLILRRRCNIASAMRAFAPSCGRWADENGMVLHWSSA
jgi:hypothetical protein